MLIRPTAVNVIPMDNYLLKVTFDNNETRVFDVKMLMTKFEWFQELKDPKKFQAVHTDGFTVEWDTGHDICPDDLYYLSKSI